MTSNHDPQHSVSLPRLGRVWRQPRPLAGLALALALSAVAAAPAAASTSAPTISFSGGAAAPAWTTGSPSVTATAAPGDASDPVASISCQMDGGAWITRSRTTDTVWVTGGQGTHTVTCYATSQGGVQSPQTSESIQIDDQMPTVALSGPALAPAWLSGPQTVTASASEAQNLSGIASVACQSGGQTVTTPGDTGSITLDGDGSHDVHCWATTNAGGQSAIASERLQLDSTLPTVAFTGGPDPSRWYPTAQTVAVTSTAPYGEASVAKTDCTLAGQTTSYPNQSGGDKQTLIVSVPAPGGTLSCTATDSAGNVSQPQTYGFQIDATAPTGYFKPDPQNPTDVVAVFSDAQSGLDTAVLQIQQPGGGWTDLPTIFDPLTGTATAQIPASMMSAGTSLLSAVVTDQAGNSATITTLADGTPALVTLPLNAPATLEEQLNRVPLAVSSHKPTDSKPRPPRKPRPIAPGFVPRLHGLKLLYGQHADLTGYLHTAAGVPLQGYVLTVSQTVYGQHTSQVLGQVTTNADGEYRYRIPYGPARTISITWPGNLLLAPEVINHPVRSVDAASLNIRKSIENRTLRLTGRVFGAYVPHRGLQVNFWWRVGCCDHWHLLTKGRTNAKGRYDVTKHVPKRLGHLPLEIRASMPGKGLWPWLRAFSPVLLERF